MLVTGRCLLAALALLCSVPSGALAAGAAPVPSQPTAPTGSGTADGGIAAGSASSKVTVQACDDPATGEVAPGPSTTVSVNRATSWQPRGGVVLVDVANGDAAIEGLVVRACFGWSDRRPADFYTKENLVGFEQAFVSIRPADKPGDKVTHLGVVVPDLQQAPAEEYGRWFGRNPSTGFGIVPVAAIRLIGYDRNGKIFDVIRPVGVTSYWYAAVVCLSVLLAIGGVLRWAVGEVNGGGGSGRGGTPRNILRNLDPRWILRVVASGDGRASLSAFQVLLWTITIIVSATYVMVLSGNLINLTPGTLTLLGIVGAASLLNQFKQGGGPAVTAAPPPGGKGDSGAASGTTAPATEPASVTKPPANDSSSPEWRHLIQGEGSGPDVTRLQMLLFTVISAAFVLLQVINTSVIPEVPEGYLILIGISNGLYVGRKFAA